MIARGHHIPTLFEDTSFTKSDDGSKGNSPYSASAGSLRPGEVREAITEKPFHSDIGEAIEQRTRRQE
jgi:hypothetical protein